MKLSRYGLCFSIGFAFVSCFTAWLWGYDFDERGIGVAIGFACVSIISTLMYFLGYEIEELQKIEY